MRDIYGHLSTCPALVTLRLEDCRCGAWSERSESEARAQRRPRPGPVSPIAQVMADLQPIFDLAAGRGQ